MRALRRLAGAVPPSAPVALAIFLLFALVVPRFATAGNLENVLRIASILAIASCGQAIVLVLGGVEFSFGASAALSSVLAVSALPDVGPVGALAIGVATVAVIGTVNGWLVSRFDLPPFLVTLGALMIASGLAASLAGGLPIDAPPSAAFAWLARGRVAGIPVPIVAAVLVLFGTHVLLRHTRIGRIWCLVGANPVAARLSGLPTRSAVVAGYGTAGLLVGLAAAILTSRVASGQPGLAPNLAFETIAACAIGGIPLAGGQGRAANVLFGVAVIAMLNNAVVLLNLPVAYQQIAIAVVILAAVLLQRDGWPGGLWTRFGRKGARS
ncbi:MAG: Sugar transporter permease [Enterovirga sp.]|jgi:ribose/xylose/arabinose/galactoside ABC-type transport system permease subunit|nr:Sugar transporter permease [Enterovirga sp.]